jgi:F-type H+-transporting ATPase subunit gamma
MAKTREIKKRIKAVGNIRRITKTMQMIATSKFARAQGRNGRVERGRHRAR